MRLEDFSMSTLQIGFMFTVIPLTYMPSMLIVTTFPKWLDRRVTLVLSALLLGIGSFLNGPSQLIGLPDKLSLIIGG